MLASILLAAVAPVPPGATFGDWTVACDNRRHCEAIGQPPEATGGGWTLHVSREPEAGAEPKISPAPAFGDGEAKGALRLDGKPTAFRLDGTAAAAPGMALLRALAAARKAEVVDGTGKVVGMIPTNGASAALRWIDDKQKRAGNVTAIVARGSAPQGAVPPPPALPYIQQPPASPKPPRTLTAAQIKAVQARAGDLCDPERAQATSFRLDSGNSLAIVGCMMGAYQGASLVVVIDEAGNWRPAPIEQPVALDKDAGPADAYLLTEAEFDETGRILFTSAKGRGMADCGMSASWAWDGRMFRLASYVALNECRGAPPGTWLSRWQTANDPYETE